MALGVEGYPKKNDLRRFTQLHVMYLVCWLGVGMKEVGGLYTVHIFGGYTLPATTSVGFWKDDISLRNTKASARESNDLCPRFLSIP